MAKDNNILLDSPEEQISAGSFGTLLDTEDVQVKQESKLDTMFAEMQELYKKGEYAQVLAIAEDAMKLEPSNGNLVLLMGLVNRDMGKKIQAVHWLRKAVNDFGMAEAEPELMKLYQSGVAGADMKKKAEAYFAKNEKAPAVKTEEKKEPADVKKAEPKQEVKVEPKAEAKQEPKKEKDLCTYPAPGTPLYTVEEYRAFVDKHSNLSEEQRLKLAEEQGRGFGYKYMSTAEQQVKLNDDQYWRPWNEIIQHAPTSSDAKKTVSTWKDVHSFARQGIFTTLHDYIEARGRKIDCWPTSEAGRGFSIFTSQGRIDGKHAKPFSYFSDDYNMTLNNGKITMNETAARTFINTYKLQPKALKKPDELVKMEKRIAELEKVPVYTNSQRRTSQTCAVVSWLPLMILLMTLLTIRYEVTGNDFFGLAVLVETITRPLFGLWDKGILGKIVSFLPIMIEGIVGSVMMLVYAIAEGFDKLAVGTGILLFLSVCLGIGGYFVCMNWLGQEKGIITKKDVKKGEDARAEAEQLKNSAELKQLREEYKVFAKKYMEEARELSEQWQRKWYYASDRTKS